jgi:hypothetical protein
MTDFLFLMHEGETTSPAQWEAYLGRLGSQGVLRGGSAIGGGVCLKKSGAAPAISRNIVGYIKVEAADMAAAQALLAGNPVYEAGGAVEVRELPVT